MSNESLNGFALLLAGLHRTVCLAALCRMVYKGDCGLLCVEGKDCTVDAAWFLLLIVCCKSKEEVWHSPAPSLQHQSGFTAWCYCSSFLHCCFAALLPPDVLASCLSFWLQPGFGSCCCAHSTCGGCVWDVTAVPPCLDAARCNLLLPCCRVCAVGWCCCRHSCSGQMERRVVVELWS